MSFLELLGGRGHYDDVESGRVSKRVVCGASWKRRSDINVRKLGVG